MRFLLHLVVMLEGAPADHGLLIAPEGEGQQPALLPLTFEALIAEEPLDALELRFQGLGVGQVIVPA